MIQIFAVQNQVTCVNKSLIWKVFNTDHPYLMQHCEASGGNETKVLVSNAHKVDVLISKE